MTAVAEEPLGAESPWSAEARGRCQAWRRSLEACAWTKGGRGLGELFIRTVKAYGGGIRCGKVRVGLPGMQVHLWSGDLLSGGCCGQEVGRSNARL